MASAVKARTGVSTAASGISHWDAPLGDAKAALVAALVNPCTVLKAAHTCHGAPGPPSCPAFLPLSLPPPTPPALVCLPACLPAHSHGLVKHPRPFPADRLAAGYAYILTHPGIPCIFCDHIFAAGSELQSKIKALSEAREGVCCAHMHAATCLITTSAISAGAPRACWNPAALPVCLLAVAAAAAAAAV